MLPPLLMLTDRHQLPAGRTLVEQVARCVDAGVRAVILRERDLEDRARADLALDLAALLEPAGGRLVMAAPELGLPHGVHLRAHDPLPRERPPVVGRSCHDADDLHRARQEEVDFVLLGPVAPTASKPGYRPALGWQSVRRLLSVPAPPRVYALGGVTPANAADWVAAGADGVAVMGALIRARDPAQVTADLLGALPTKGVA